MNKRGRNVLSILDNAVRWTGIPARVTNQMSEALPDNRKHRPLRWIPLCLIGIACALFFLSLKWPTVLLTSLGAVIAALTPTVHMNGPLGKSSFEDDEREAALRKDSFLVCLGVLVAINSIGQLLFMGLALLQRWQIVDGVSIAASAFLLNLTLFGCLPTLYASWRMRELVQED